MIQDRSRIINIEIEDQLKKAFMEYSMSVIVARALPDSRDGLKPSQRRILYAMHELNLRPGGGFRKCAKIAGDTSGNYHPHGEQVVYPTMVRMAQPWILRYPLVDGQGNFGSIDGDPPAAMRYTEARLHKTSIDLMEDLDKETVNYKGNYDDTRKEPVVFPSKFPNLLVNGSSGIAVGMATSIPPHNLTEVSNAIIALIENPELSALDIMEYIKGPDFPTGGFIVGKAGIYDYFQTGRGKITMRGKASIETKENGDEQIVISEIPYQLNKTFLIDRMVELVKDKRIEGISDIRDESGRQGMRLVVTVKRNGDANIILNKLYKFSQLQDTFSVINLALVDGVPKVLNVKEMIENYLKFRHEVVVRRTQFELKNAEERLHILEGYLIALDNLDEVIKTIRASETPSIAGEQLQLKFGLSEIQAKAILEMRLQRLTGLERQKIEEEHREILKTVEYLKRVLAEVELRMEIIKEEVIAMRDKYGDERRTTIIEHQADFEVEDLIAEEFMMVTISHEGYIKRMPVDTYKNQNRGGKGLQASNLKENDFIQYVFVASTHSYIMFFTNLGKCYWLKVYEIPLASRQARGKAIVNLLNLEKEEKIKAFVSVRHFNTTQFMVMVTKKGTIKKTELSAYSRPMQRGIIAIRLREDDELIDAKLADSSNDIILATSRGFTNRFNESIVSVTSRATIGVKGISLRASDVVVSMVIVKRSGTILAISENGFGKRTEESEYSITNRGTKGYISLKPTARNGSLVSLMEVVDSDDLIIVTKDGMIIRQSVANISVYKRNTQGVKLINLNEGDKVYDIARIASEDIKEEFDNIPEGTPVVNSIPEEDFEEDLTDDIMEDEVDDTEEDDSDDQE